MGGDPVPGPLDILREWFYSTGPLAWNIERIAWEELPEFPVAVVEAIGPRCFECGGPLRKRRFVDGWKADGSASEDDTYNDWYCDACKIRWVPFHEELEEAEG